MKQHLIFVTPNLATIGNWIARLLPFLGRCEVHIFHFAKLQKEEPIIINGAIYHDISYFRYSKIDYLLETINPEKIVIFSFRSVIEQLFISICRERGIKSIYLEHGILNEDSEHFRKLKGKDKIIMGLKRHLNYSIKFIQFSLKTSGSFRKLKYLLDFYTSNQFRKNPFDWYLVYGERCMNYLGHIYNLKLGLNTRIVGYPMFNSDKDKNEAKASVASNPKGILYVHQPFIDDGYATINYDEEKQFILNMASKLESYGDFTVLLHPRASLVDYKERFKDTHINVIQSASNYRSYIDKKLIVGHYSTALLFPMFLNIKTIRTEFPSVKHHSIYDDYLEYVDFTKDKVVLSETFVGKEKCTNILGVENTYSYIAQNICEL